MGSFKINKNLEKILWRRRHGEPLVETQSYRIYFSEQKLMLLWIRSKQKEQLHEDGKGIFLLRVNEISQGKLYISKPLQDELRDAIAERELLGE